MSTDWREINKMYFILIALSMLINPRCLWQVYTVYNLYLYVFPNYSWFTVIQWFTVIYTLRAICECNFVMKMRLKSALNMPNLNGTLNLFAKHCVYIFYLEEEEGAGWWCLIILLRWQLWQSSPKIWERKLGNDNLGKSLEFSPARYLYRRKVPQTETEAEVLAIVYCYSSEQQEKEEREKE